MPTTEMIKVTGIPDVIKMLDNMPATLVGFAWNRSLQAAGAVMRDELQRQTPYSGESASGWTARGGVGNAAHGGRGALRENIRTKITLDDRLRGGSVDVGFMNSDLAAIASWVEYGHRIVGRRPGLKDTGNKVPPHPFLRPAFAACWERAVEAFANTFVAQIERGIPGVPTSKQLAKTSSQI